MQDIEALEKELALFYAFIAQFGDTYLSDEGLQRLNSLKSELTDRKQRESAVEIRVWIPQPDVLTFHNIYRNHNMVPVRVSTEYPGDLLWGQWQGNLLLARISFDSQISDTQARRAIIEERAEAALQELDCHPMRREREWGIEKATMRFWVSQRIYKHLGVNLDKRPGIAVDIAFVGPDGKMSIWGPIPHR